MYINGAAMCTFHASFKLIELLTIFPLFLVHTQERYFMCNIYGNNAHSTSRFMLFFLEMNGLYTVSN